jgi:hypothetical protein
MFVAPTTPAVGVLRKPIVVHEQERPCARRERGFELGCDRLERRARVVEPTLETSARECLNLRASAKALTRASALAWAPR